MGNNKSTPIIVIGVAIFVIGGAALFLVLRNDNSSKKSPAANAPAAATTTTTIAGSLSFNATTASTLAPVVIPPGDNALALQMDYFGGVGGYARAGSLINVYAIYNKDCAPGTQIPLTVALIKSNVKVLEVIGSGPAQSGSSDSYLLGVTPQDAATLLFFQKLGTLYFTLTTGSEPAVSPLQATCAKPA